MLSPITPAAHTGRELIIRLLIARPRRKPSAREGLWHGAIVPRSAVAGYGQLELLSGRAHDAQARISLSLAEKHKPEIPRSHAGKGACTAGSSTAARAGCCSSSWADRRSSRRRFASRGEPT